MKKESLSTAGTDATDGYADLLARVKGRVAEARVRAGLAANAELIRLHWEVGFLIVRRQASEGWGTSVIDRLSQDLRREFPGIKGFSTRNIQRMRMFHLAHRVEEANPPQAVAELTAPPIPSLLLRIPWGHNVILLEKVKDGRAREWYVRQTVEHGWSRNVLALHVDAGDYERKGHAVTNFRQTLPDAQSDMAQGILKDPYLFDFLGIADEMRERELEEALLGHLREFLLELGNGFAFVGNQVRLAVGDEDYYIDLLFYHLKLRCYVVIDLKTRPFMPEDAGKMNFYLNAVDDLLRHPDDRESIGLVLCRQKGKSRLVLEYALRGLAKPIGISGYELTRALPEGLVSSLPTIDQIEREIAGAADYGDAEEADGEVGRLVQELAAKYRAERERKSP